MKLRSFSKVYDEFILKLKIEPVSKPTDKQDKSDQKLKVKETPEEIELKKYKKLLDECKEMITQYKDLIISLIDDIEEYEMECELKYKSGNSSEAFTGIITPRTMKKLKNLFPEEYKKFEI